MSEAPKKRWYVVQAFSGFEGRVAQSLREHIKLHDMEELFGEVMVHPIAMDDGLRFAIREGGRTVGAGVVAKVIA